MRKRTFPLVWAAALAMATAGLSCGRDGANPPSAEQSKGKTIHLSSSAFPPGGPIPVKYTGEGEDVSPPLAWDGVPAGTKEMALICDDPDAPRKEPWVHWVLTNIPADANGLGEGEPSGRPGKNDFGRTGYNGPMPPPGKVHHYCFRLYALDAPLDLKDAPTKENLLKAMEGHILAVGELVGTYEKKR
jgi:hypothetical protein